MNTKTQNLMMTLLLTLSLVSASVFAQTTTVGRPQVFVDANLGSDATGTGSQTNPWQTITHALTQVTPPVEIHIAAGLYDTALGESFPLNLGAGIALIGAGMGQTVIQGQGMPNMPGQSGGVGIMLPAQQNHAPPDGLYRLTFEHFDFAVFAVQGSPLSSHATGMIRVCECEFSNIIISGVSLGYASLTSIGLVMEDCFIHDIPTGSGVQVASTNSSAPSIVRRCTILNIATGVSGSNFAALTDNIIRNAASFGAFVSNSQSPLEVARNVITNSGDYGLGVGSPSTGSTARVHDNLIVGAGNEGMRLLNTALNPPHLVYHNTLVNTGPVAIKFQATGTTLTLAVAARLWNNLISGSTCPLEGIPLGPNQCSIPCFANTAGTVIDEGGNLSDMPVVPASNCAPTGFAVIPVIPQSSGPFQFADPANEDYTLVAGSPGVDEGAPMGQFQGFFDFLGNIRSVDGDGDGVPLPDVGAFELNPGPTNGVLAIGHGCSVFSTDPATFPPLTAVGGAPTPGNASFGFDVFGSFPNLPTFMTVAYDLAPHREPLLNPRCVVWLDLGTALPPLFASGTLDATGHWLIPAPLPNIPALSGFGLHLQGLIHDPASGITALTNALEIVIQ